MSDVAGRRGGFNEFYDRYADFLRALWDEHRTLYWAQWEEVEAAAIKDLVREEMSAFDLEPSIDPEGSVGLTGIVRGHSLDSDRGATLEQIGDELGLTRERARQIEAIALTKIRRAWRRAELCPPRARGPRSTISSCRRCGQRQYVAASVRLCGVCARETKDPTSQSAGWCRRVATPLVIGRSRCSERTAT